MKTVWAVVSAEYGLLMTSVVHVCETKEIADSWRLYEHETDIEGPLYTVSELQIKSQFAPNIKEVF